MLEYLKLETREKGMANKLHQRRRVFRVMEKRIAK
jgi:hypothetical protein